MFPLITKHSISRETTQSLMSAQLSASQEADSRDGSPPREPKTKALETLDLFRTEQTGKLPPIHPNPY